MTPKIIQGLAFVAVAAALIWGGSRIVPEQDSQSESRIEAPSNNQPTNLNFMEDFKKEDITIGAGAEAKEGSHVYVHYVGTLTDGTEFDNSLKRGQPIDFVLGSGRVIPGWELGLMGMKVGGKRELTIPYQLAYGEEGYGPIPPKATLRFTVELVDVK